MRAIELFFIKLVILEKLKHMKIQKDFYKKIAIFLCLGLFLGLGGCSTTSSQGKKDSYVERPAQQLYQEAEQFMDQGSYQKAAKLFNEVERQHPYSNWAIKAKLMAGYSFYKINEYNDALAALDHYIKLHPGHEEVPYAYYLKAMSYYEQISDVKRDQEMTAKAQEALQEIIRRFPNSKYATDAKFKLDLTEDHLAGKEMSIGRYYLNRKFYAAALNRFLQVIENYKTTSQIPEALHRTVECYLALGLHDEAIKAAAVIAHNYPDSKWYEYSYNMIKGYDIVLKGDNKQ